MRIACFASILVLFARTALAEPTPESRAAAEALFLEGKALVEKGELQPACQRFEQSQKLDPQVGTLLYLATCHEQTGKTATAWIEFKDALALAEASGKLDRIRQAKEGTERVEAVLSRATIKIDKPLKGLEVRVNGVPAVLDASLPFDPGTLVVTAAAPGHTSKELTVELPKGPVAIDIQLPLLEEVKPTKPKVVPPPPVEQVDHTLAFAIGGSGLGLGAVGFALGGAAWATSDSADSHCRGTACTQEGLDNHDTANGLAWGSNVALIAGGALLATGVILYFVYEPEAPPAVVAAPWLDPVTGSGGLRIGGTL